MSRIRLIVREEVEAAKPVSEARNEPSYANNTLLRDQIDIIGANAEVIFDIGSHTGESTLDYLKNFPGARVFAFEPDKTNFSAAFASTGEYRDRCRLYPYALADSDGTADFNVNTHNGTHSLLEIGAVELWREPARTAQKVTVETRSLDRFAAEHNISKIDILKIDIQGGELLALKGAENLLQSSRIRLLALEVEFQPLYKDQPLFWDICEYLYGFGYSLYNLYDLVYHQDNERLLCWGDAIFLSRELYGLQQGKYHQALPGGASFDELLPSLADKWREAPGGSDAGDRIFTDALLDRTDEDLLLYWEQLFSEGLELRGWYWHLYRNLFQNKKVLEIGSGMGFDAVYFASCGADWFCCDIARSNLKLIERVADAKGLSIGTLHIDSIKAFDSLPMDFDFVYCNGSLHHIPFNQAIEECAAILPRLKIGGRWIELAYPRERWVREGMKPFAEWGKMTDGERTPWVEWYDIEKLKSRLTPYRFETVLEYRFNSDSFVWMDAVYAGLSSDVLPQPEEITPPRHLIVTPPSIWNNAWSMDLNGTRLDGNVTAEIVCLIEFGAIGIAFEQNGKFVSREVIVGARTGTQLLYISTMDFGPGTGLTVRNASGLGASQMEIESIKLRRTL
jgi:FkbM family methyltransferase